VVLARYVPVPDTAACWGLAPPLSLTLTEALREPVLMGLNVTVMLQLAPAATWPTQVLVWAKSPGSRPANLTPLTVSEVAPVFVSWICFGELFVPTFEEPNVRLAGESVTTVPAPASSIICGLLDALSATEIVPDLVPLLFGEKVALIVQFAPAATLLPHDELMPNWPSTFIEEMVSAVVPVLVSVTVRGVLVLPTSCA